MTAAARMSLPVPAGVAQWWSAKASRERRVLTTLIGMAIAIVLWTLLWQPLVRDLAALRLAQGQRAAALVDARRMAEEMRGLSRAPAPAAPIDDRASLERVLAQHGLRGGAVQIAWQDGRAHLVFAAVGYDALIAALEALQRETRLRVVEATLTARVEPRTVRAELTLGR